jgi:hypothetical protein
MNVPCVDHAISARQRKERLVPPSAMTLLSFSPPGQVLRASAVAGCRSPSERAELRWIERLERCKSHDMTASAKKSSPVSASSFRFPKTILFSLEGRWHFVGAADEALECLKNVFPDRKGPSHRRAVDTCAAFVLGNATADGAQATFIVAVMEGGHPFEVLDEGAELEERLVAAATENGLLDMLLELDEDQKSSSSGVNPV